MNGPILAAWTLIIVTYGGDVGHSRDYSTKYLCEQAKSLALTGMTIEQNKAADEAYRLAEEKADAEWDKANPPRLPSTDDERKFVASAGGSAMTVSDGYSWSYVTAEGLIGEGRPGAGGTGMSPTYSPSNGESVTSVRGRWIRKNQTDVKHAECVPEESGAPR